MREYFKGLKKGKEEQRFRNWLSKNDADYIEEEDGKLYGVFKMPEQHGTYRAAVRLCLDGDWVIGTIDNDCDNFAYVNDSNGFYQSEAQWVVDMICLVSEWNPKKLSECKIQK